MTGYGAGMNSNFKVEVRSSNHRGLDIHVRIPSYLYSYEPEIRRLVRKNFSRGRIEIFVSPPQTETMRLKINKPLAKELYYALASLKDELSIPGDIGIDVLTAQKDIFLQEEPEVELKDFHDALNAALEDLKEMRIKEGEGLVRDIMERLHIIEGHIKHLEDKKTGFIANAKKALSERLKDLMADTSIDESRLIQEVAILLERSDITEELVRIKSHLRYMEDLSEKGGSVGKKLDFLTQELQRELNATGSKAASPEITPIVIELKDEIEKIREQVQNLQ